jgi:hypothetical protein
MLLWAVPWAAFGLVVSLLLLTNPNFAFFPVSRLRLVGISTLVGAAVGAVNGLAFATILMGLERGRSADTVRPWRVGLAGGIGSGAIGMLFFHRISVALAIAAIGFLGGTAMAYLARRSASTKNGIATPPLA